MPNPLDQYVTTKPGNWPADFKVPVIPKLRDALSGRTLPEAFAIIDQKLEQWRKDHEQSISERLRVEAPTATTTTVQETTVIQQGGSTSSVSGGVTSVNGKTGAVDLTTDDVPQGTANLYLTSGAWLALFDSMGFHKNSVDASEGVIIPAGRNLVMTGPLTIDGTLVIDGYLAFV